MSGSIVLLIIFLLIFVVAMRAAGKAQKRARALAKQPAKPLPAPAKGFSKDSYGGLMSGAAGLGTLAVTSYVAASAIKTMSRTDAEAQPLQQTPSSHTDPSGAGPDVDDSVSSGADLSDGFDDSFDDLW